MIQKKTTFLVMSIVVIAILAGTGGFFAAEHMHLADRPAQPAQVNPAPGTPQKEAAHEGHGHKEQGHDHEEQGHGHEEQGHDHEAEVSDLDRPVDEMWGANCEHGILQHQCDECRYEIGTVKLDPHSY